MTQVNSPYPATPYLAQFLKEQGYHCKQKDLGLDLFHRVFSKEGLQAIVEQIALKKNKNEIEEFFLMLVMIMFIQLKQ